MLPSSYATKWIVASSRFISWSCIPENKSFCVLFTLSKYSFIFVAVLISVSSTWKITWTFGTFFALLSLSSFTSKILQSWFNWSSRLVLFVSLLTILFNKSLNTLFNSRVVGVIKSVQKRGLSPGKKRLSVGLGKPTLSTLLYFPDAVLYNALTWVPFVQYPATALGSNER